MMQAQIEDLVKIRKLFNICESICNLYHVDITSRYNTFVRGHWTLSTYREGFVRVTSDLLMIEASEKPNAVADMIEALTLLASDLCSYIHMDAQDLSSGEEE